MNCGSGCGWVFVAVALVCLAASHEANAGTPTRPAVPKSGIEYASAEIRALQADDTTNPGMLWVARGEMLWNETAGKAEKSCAQCHAAAPVSMKGVAMRYPQIEARTQSPINLEGRINLCRVNNQRASHLPYESAELLGLTAYVAHQSRGLAGQIVINEKNRTQFARGATLYRTRMGQINLACTHCHDQNAGKTLLAEKISEGHSNAYPIYRLEWQGAGSLHRRFRSCMVGVRAEPFAPGSDEYLALELYLAWRANGLAVETPGVRR